ncbi:hypothetical protein MRB53_001614 [Persea americana]|uniref:Uncharacterized protein n=1 Tax=Persea americana TaxID=3435 RepID=A0ACC2MT56_PERAE|nr:hypothetical protein MRB53_001614 [Persea americana]
METENGVSHGSRKEPGRYIHKTPKKHPHRTLDLDLFIRETKAFHVKSPQFTAPPLESSPILRRKEKKSITAERIRYKIRILLWGHLIEFEI